MTVPTTITAAARWYIERGFRVVPLFGVDERGRCRCGDADCEQAIGKQPLRAIALRMAQTSTRANVSKAPTSRS